MFNSCPLCLSDSIAIYFQNKSRSYLQCNQCDLVFVPENQHLNTDSEKAIYDLHQNYATDAKYRLFLSRLVIPLLEDLKPNSNGLDFGSGPGDAVLSLMMAESGHTMDLYDPYYAQFAENLAKKYDFISCCEVVEHFRQPAHEFNRLFRLLKPKGRIGIMTKLVKNAEAFSNWHYKNDFTHICFFSIKTIEWLADYYQCKVKFIGNDVIIFDLIN